MDDRGEWDRTLMIEQRLRGNAFFEEPSPESRHGKWHGRDIIGRDCPINGGVYLTGGQREAIVVDDDEKKQPRLKAAYNELLRRRREKESRNIPFKKGILEEVFALTEELLPYSDAVVAKVTSGLQPDQKVALGLFIENKGGVCRHQALLAGYLLEKLKAEGYVNGQASVDRNYIRGKGGHAWVRYVNSVGDVMIIDPAQKFIGRIEDAGKDQWFYERPSTFADKLRKFLKRKK